MPVAMLYEFSDMTQEHYDRLLAETYGDSAMAGVTAHAAGPIEGGGWWAFDLYESDAAAEAIGPPAIEKLREMGVTAEPSIRTLHVYNSR